LPEEEDEISDTSQDFDGYEDDYYIDRDFENIGEVAKAKEDA